ncbi:MAG: homoserine O-succinyltransferase [Bryobacterales bacterium]|nr:homoserine O-succinyltransferase [Bryobacterales bacterium]
MPVVVDGIQGPVRSSGPGPVGPTPGWDGRPECIHIALVNNMPDAALEDTEQQFFELLRAASDTFLVRLGLFSLPNVPRADKGRLRLDRLYFDIEELWQNRFDAVIITGAEPRQRELRCEPYWPAMTAVLEWAAENTASTVLSCLAAHAGVLHSDEVGRHPLPDKQFGVFNCRKTADHPLTYRSPDRLCFPHSRWNEVRANALASRGYTVLTHSAEAGVDLFVKKNKRSLFVHFQGHPEYGRLTLLKEYRRDIRRYLNGERETYPSMPQSYFDAGAAEFLTAFRKQALANRSPEFMSQFPKALETGVLRNTWQPSGSVIYRNWLQYIALKKAESPAFAAVPLAARARSAAGR